MKMESGVTTRLYGAWLRWEDKGSILFVNPSLNVGEQQELTTTMENFFDNRNGTSNTFLLGESSRGDNKVDETGDMRVRKDDSDDCFKNSLAMLLELEVLYVTFTNQKLVREIVL